MLIDYQLFETVDKVKQSIDRLRQFEPKEGYYGAFSGGKDSTVLKELARLSGVRCDWHYNWTTVDPPELLAFVKKHHPDVEIHRPKKTMWDLIAKKGLPPTRVVRYCCEELKEDCGSGRVILTGIRWAESFKRSKRKMVETCFKDKSKTYINAIVDWTDADVWEFIKGRGIAYCSLYDEGFKRLGCIACPKAGPRQMKREFERWPKYKEAYMRAFSRAWPVTIGRKLEFHSAEEMMTWWLEEGTHKGDPDQTIMFE